MIPGFTINRFVKISRMITAKSALSESMKTNIPTLVGLASIPFIIHPIDHFVDYLMDNSIRVWTKKYLDN